MNLKVVSSSESDNETFHFKAIFFSDSSVFELPFKRMTGTGAYLLKI